MAVNIVYILPQMVIKNDNDGIIICLANAQRTNAVMCSEGNKITVEALKSADVLILLFLPIIMSIFINDFSFQTIRNSVISGYSKVQIYISKVAASIILCMAIVLVYSLVVYIAAFIKGGYNLEFSSIIDTLRVILLQTPLYIGFISIACLIGLIFKSKTIVFAVSMLYQVLNCQIVNLLGNVGENIAKFEPISILDKAADIGYNTVFDNFTFVMLGFVITAVSLLIGILYVKRMEIK